MARQRGGQSGRSAGRNIQDPAQDLDTGDAGMQGGAASGGATLGGGTERSSTYGGDAYRESAGGAGGYGGGSYGGGAAGGGTYGGSAAGGGYGGGAYGAGTEGGFAEGAGTQSAGAYGGGAYGTEAQGGFAESGAARGGFAQGSEAQGGVIDEAKQKAQQLASETKDKAGEKVQSGLASGKNRAAETLNSVAQSLHSSSQQLRDQNKGGVSRYVEQAAGRVERAANYLQQTDVNVMVDQVENFARRNPVVFIGGAFALGLLGARFLKSSRSKAYGDVPRDRAVVPYRAGYERSADFPRSTGRPVDREAWAAAGPTGASATGDRGLSATGGAGLGGAGSYDDTRLGQSDFGGSAPGTGGGDRY